MSYQFSYAYSRVFLLTVVVTVLLSWGCGKAKNESLPPEASGTVAIALSDHPSLQRAGNAVSLHDTPLDRGLIIACTEERVWRAYDSWCTHQGCEVSVSAYGGLECPCHISRFTIEGVPTTGPAPRPLVEYKTQLDGDSLLVMLDERTVR